MRWASLVLAFAACNDEPPVPDAPCTSIVVYLNRTGGTYDHGAFDDAFGNLSVLVDSPQTLAPWPHDDTNWRSLVGCITAALAPFPRLTISEIDPGAVPHVEIVFTTTYWAGPASTNMVIPASCRVGQHELEFVFGDALPPTYARACHVAMLGFAQMTANLSLGDNCADYVNNSIDCVPTRGFLDVTVNCVDAANQPTTCRCGGTTENTYQALGAAFPLCPARR